MGAVAMALLVFAARQYEFGDGAIGLNALAIAETKASLGWGQAVALGVLCNALVCLAVWLSDCRAQRDRQGARRDLPDHGVRRGRVRALRGEHVLPADRPAREGTSLADGGDYADLSWSNAVFGNLLPVTLGNIFGGAVMVGLVYRRPAGRPPRGRPTA